MLRLSVSVLSAALMCTAAMAGEQSSPNEVLPAGVAKGKAQAACLTCHEARIIVQQRLSAATWAKEVDKMIKWGAEVDPKDRQELIDYFSLNFGADQPSYVPRKTSVAKAKTRPQH